MRRTSTQPSSTHRARRSRPRSGAKPLAAFLAVGLTVVVVAMFVGRAAGEHANRAEWEPLGSRSPIGRQYDAQVTAPPAPTASATRPSARPTARRPPAAARPVA